MKKFPLILSLLIAVNCFAATEKLVLDTKTHVLTGETGTTIIDAKGVTLTVGGMTIYDGAGVKTVVTGSTSGAMFGATGNKIGFLGATPVVLQTGNIFTALTSYGLVSSPSLTIANVTSLQGELDLKANDSATVHKTGNETIAGTKTYSTVPIVPAYSILSSSLSLNADTVAKNLVIGAGAMPDSGGTATYNAIGGYQAFALAGGHGNTGWGPGAGRNCTTCFDTVMIGADAGADRYSRSGIYNTGDNIVAVGNHTAGYATTARFITAVGSSSLEGGPDALSGTPLTGSGDTGVGAYSLFNIGGNSSGNTAIGYSAGYNCGVGCNDNVFIGPYAGDDVTTGDLNIIFGRDVQVPSPTGNGQLNIGNLITATGLTQGGEPANGAVTIHGSLSADSYLNAATTVMAGSGPPPTFNSKFYAYSLDAPFFYASDGKISQNYGVALEAESVPLQGGGGSIGPVNDGTYVPGLRVNYAGDAFALHNFTVAGTLTAPTLAGTTAVPVSDGTAVFAFDSSAGAYHTVSDGDSWAPFGNSNNFAGECIVTATNGQEAIVHVGSFNSVNIVSRLPTSGNFTTTQGSSSGMNVYLDSHVFKIENTMGSAVGFKVTVNMRTKAGN